MYTVSFPQYCLLIPIYSRSNNNETEIDLILAQAVELLDYFSYCLKNSYHVYERK